MEIIIPRDENGNPLHPAVQATALAKYSRSPLSIREILATLTPEEADKFQDKWTNAYGHSSVEELCSIPVCFEGVSIIASKVLESFQRAGYSEKSTRYQEFSKDSFVKNIKTFTHIKHSLNEEVEFLYDAYQRLGRALTPLVRQKMFGSSATLSQKEESALKARVFDNVRYLLPAGTCTNVGAVANGRDIKYMCRTLLSHPLAELRDIGIKFVEQLRSFNPVLVSSIDTQPAINQFASIKDIGFDLGMNDWRVYMCNCSDNVIPRLSRLLSSHYGIELPVFLEMLKNRDKTPVPSVLRRFRADFYIQMDYGAYRDLQRHRRCEQYSEILSAKNGYLVPDDILGTELEKDYLETMNEARNNYFNCAEAHLYSEEELQYIVPLGYLHRSIFSMDLEELFYIVELRTKPQGHISYRRVAYRMYEQAYRAWPELMKCCQAVRPTEIGLHT